MPTLPISRKPRLDRILSIDNIMIHGTVDKAMGEWRIKAASLIQSIYLCRIKGKVQLRCDRLIAPLL
jgi:hypothetical protein